MHAPAALANKRKDLRIDRFHAQARAPISDAVAEIPIEGFRLVETALVHRSSGTAVVTDLVHNVGRPTHLWTKVYASVMGFYDRVAQSAEGAHATLAMATAWLPAARPQLTAAPTRPFFGRPCG